MYIFIKRIADLLMAMLLLVILTPLLLPIILLLLLTGEHYVFYKQERVGIKRNHFQVWKFATMLKDSPNMKGGVITSKNDYRLTPLGGFLRSTKINEIPQLINVILGDMSFVGPRPVMPKSFSQYPKKVQEEIYQVKPGITGLGSIVFRNEEQLIEQAKKAGIDPWDYYCEVIYPYKGELEKWYKRHQSFWLDIKILLVTILVVVFPNAEAVDWIGDFPKRDLAGFRMQDAGSRN